MKPTKPVIQLYTTVKYILQEGKCKYKVRQKTNTTLKKIQIHFNSKANMKPSKPVIQLYTTVKYILHARRQIQIQSQAINKYSFKEYIFIIREIFKNEKK